MLSQHPTDEEIRRLIEKVIRAARLKELDGSIEAYTGDEYFVSDWETPFEQAVAEVQQSFTLYLIISIHGLEYILADKYATAGLKKCLIKKDRHILKALADYGAGKISRKPGPPPKDGKYKADRALELRLEGKTLGQIAREMYGDPKKANIVSAHLAQVKKKRQNPPTT